MIARRPLLLVAAACVTAIAVGLGYGQGGTVALAVALALAAGLAVATALRLRPAPRQPAPRRARDDEMPLRLRQIGDVLRDSGQSQFGVDRSLRPLLVPLVTARLGRRGLDLALPPRRAEALLGDRLWEIVRPDRTSTGSRRGPGLAGDDLRETIERLEQL